MRPEVTMGEIPSSIKVPEDRGGKTAHVSLEKLYFIKKMNEQNLIVYPYTKLVCFSLLAALRE